MCRKAQIGLEMFKKLFWHKNQFLLGKIHFFVDKN